ncbi:winged helix-turn-helix transcriptional regulator [Thalassorhabdomicrobium marinisediminis]|uniref:winged helix-turn-helix transcriptional regulator n=1 Tax=Thalassorhabdomicrobium marinisediminis TaxID=2170577 RepID=UPI002490C090|nr:helix-turn-helix domain-containing protein [Thalassorhabdomicrobium marinisediminis]
METTPETRTTASHDGEPAAPDAVDNAMPCGADRLLRMLWGQWKTHVIYVLGEQQACRFGVLRRRIAGISPKVLTTRLRELEADGLVWREQENTIPPKVTYGLTKTGQAVHHVLRDIEKIEV